MAQTEEKKHIYLQTEALPYISAHQLLVHLVHVSSEAIQSFCPVGRPLLQLVITFLIAIIIQII